MKLEFVNTFHQTSTDFHFYSSNPSTIILTGKQTRRILEEMCDTEGCECFRDLKVTFTGNPAVVKWMDPCADDDKPAMEIALTP